MADMVSVLAAYAVAENQTADVVTMDTEKLETLKEVFWTIHTITWYVMDDDEGVSTLFIELTHKEPEEIPDLFGWNASQRSAFTALLLERALIAELISDDLSAAFSEVPYGGFSYAGSGLLLWPVPGRSHVSSEMGYRIHPVDGYRKLHTGMDIPAPTGTQVVAAADGLVVRAGWYGSYGNVVMIDHGSIGGEHLVTLYAHNSAVLVSAGDTVAAGDAISLIGSTGRSTGPHCHFEVRVGGAYQNPRGWL
jgi:murein DD-endopeptidase MepM/ murein hydrolase activator NlpD